MTDALDNPTGFFLTPGQPHDLEGAGRLLPKTEAGVIIADKACGARARAISPLEAARKKAIIPSKGNAKTPREFDGREKYLSS
jgi:hypothetical protein